MVYSHNIFLPKGLAQHSQDTRLVMLNHIDKLKGTNLWSDEWKQVEEVGLTYM